jgi:hypothetical protein
MMRCMNWAARDAAMNMDVRSGWAGDIIRPLGSPLPHPSPLLLASLSLQPYRAWDTEKMRCGLSLGRM